MAEQGEVTMRTKRSRLIVLVVLGEIIVGLGAIVWRISGTAAPEANLKRLSASTAADIQRLQLQVRSNSLAAWLELGEAYLAYGYFPQAEACLRRAVLLAPENFPAVYAHAYALERLCQLPQAIAEFQLAASLSRGESFSNCWYHIGLCYLKQEKVDAAETAFLQAGEKYAPALHARARILIRNGRTHDALELIETLRRKLALDIQTEMLAHQAYRQLQDAFRMAQSAERAERSFPKLRLADHWEYLHPIRTRYGLMAKHRVSQDLMEQGKSHHAAADFQKMLDEEPPDFTDGMFEQGVRLSLVTGRVDIAEQILRRFQKRMALSPPALHLWGDVMATVGNLEEATQVWEKANQLLPDEESFRSLAAVYSEAGDTAQVEQNKGFAALHTGIVAYRQNQLDVAMTQLGQAKKVLPQECQIEYYFGEINFAKGELERAREAFHACLKINPDYERARERLDSLAK